VVLIITFGTFYVRVGISESNLPELYIKNEFGEKSEASPIVLSGSYGKGWKTNDQITITQKGSSYNSQKSFFDQLDPNIRQEKLIKLQKEERQFMRGKIAQDGFYIENNFIVYADKDYSYDSNNRRTGILFKIYTLDKKNNETQSFNIHAPLIGSYSDINILDVQVIGKELKIITRGSLNNEHSLPEIHVYSINLVKKEVVNDSTIFKGQAEINGITNNIYEASEPDVTEPSNYEVFTNNVYKQTTNEGNSSYSKVISRDVIIYNLETNQLEKLKISREQLNKWNDLTRLFLQGDILYATTQDKEGINGIDVMKYNLKLQKVISEQRFSNKSLGLNTVNNYNIQNDKLYLLDTKNNHNSLPGITVVDLQTNKPIYKGRVVLKNNNKDLKNRFVNLGFYNISVK
jgi:hypothetical protein